MSRPIDNVQPTYDAKLFNERNNIQSKLPEGDRITIITKAVPEHSQLVQNWMRVYNDVIDNILQQMSDAITRNDYIDDSMSYFIDHIKSFILYAKMYIVNILIIDYANYHFDMDPHKQIKLEKYIRENNINAVIIVRKQKDEPTDFISQIIPEERILNIRVQGIILKSSGQEEFKRENTGFGVSSEVSLHILNGYDDLILLYIYELCKAENRNPVIYSGDSNIKIDLLGLSRIQNNVLNYKYILPFWIHIGDKRYAIDPYFIDLKGNNYIYDNYYHSRNPRVAEFQKGDRYLEKYLKYKNKYFELKKALDKK